MFETVASLEGGAAILVGFGLCHLCFAVGVFASYLPRYVRVFMMVFPELLVGSVSVSLLFV
ncbi:MAG: hypothetical protein F4053_09060 [Proteobacteria bacterium]|nr:hypothetical protein [Pseudomonadota bacterium]